MEINGISPHGRKSSLSVTNKDYENHLFFTIEDPELWWPNGYGRQPLYQVEVLLKSASATIDSQQLQIGLRTLTIKRQKDPMGRILCF